MNRAPARTQSAAAASRRYVRFGIEAGHDRVGRAGGGPAVDALLVHPGRGMPGGHDLEADVAQLALQAARAEDQHAPDARLVVDEVERRGPRGRDDRVGRDRRAHGGEAGHVVGAVVHRVVRDVDDVVAAGGPVGEDGGHARHGVGAAIDDAVEVDEEEQAHAADRSRRPIRA